MPATFIQSAANTANGVASLSATFGANNTFTNFLVSVFRIPSGAAQTFLVTDTQNNNWVKLLDFNNPPEKYQLWYALECKGGGNTVTITSQSGNANLRIITAEYSGVTNVSPGTDGTSTNIGTGTAVSSGAATTAFATDLLIGFTANQTADGVSFTPTSGFTVRANETNNLYLAELNTVAAGSFTFTGTDGSSVTWGAGVAAFKVSAPVGLYGGYGVNDCGGVALPAQEPSSTSFATQTNSVNQLTPASGRGPTNTGVFYQGGGGGTTPGNGQIFPSGRS